MDSTGVYSLTLERLYVERQQSVIRLMMSLASALLLIKCYFDQIIIKYDAPSGISLYQLIIIIVMLMTYSIVMWALLKWKPERLRITMAVSSVVEIIIITYLIHNTAKTDLPFYLWYVFYVASVSTRYGKQYSILALSASIVSCVAIICAAPQPYMANIPGILGFTSFLLVLAYLFGQISERQLSYQASLVIVNEFRGELAGLATSSEIIDHLLFRTKKLLNAENTFFLPAQRGVDGSEAPGLRSAGADPILLATFREDGGMWNVEEILKEQSPLVINNIAKNSTISKTIACKLNLKNLAAAPMMVRCVPVGVVYVANRKDRKLSNSDLQLLELIATQAAPVIENALLWERLREAATSEERLRIARDLHDNLLQTLAAIKLHLERCKILAGKDSEKTIDGIERIHQIATHGLAEVRSYLSELRLMGPEPSRFNEAMSRCAADAESRGKFKVKLTIENDDPPMHSNTALVAFQITRELLNNAVTHSQAENVQIRVHFENGKHLLEIIDDGIGFDVAKVRAQKASEGHLGLVGVDERARQSDGVFTLTSQPGQGTHATIIWPVSMS